MIRRYRGKTASRGFLLSGVVVTPLDADRDHERIVVSRFVLSTYACDVRVIEALEPASVLGLLGQAGYIGGGGRYLPVGAGVRTSNDPRFVNELTCPTTLRVFRTEEGAGEHCQVGNLRLATSVIYDWLDGTVRTNTSADD